MNEFKFLHGVTFPKGGKFPQMLKGSVLLFENPIRLGIWCTNQFLRVEFHFRSTARALGDHTLLAGPPGGPFHKVKDGKKGDVCTLPTLVFDRPSP